MAQPINQHELDLILSEELQRLKEERQRRDRLGKNPFVYQNHGAGLAPQEYYDSLKEEPHA